MKAKSTWMKKGCYSNYAGAKGFDDLVRNLPVPVSKECFEQGDRMMPRYLFIQT
ncbi:hypothetical protein LJC56_10140 [Christensenellaceae bacterium OttesenSCG-928-K19]|nr:hypothetical protein [Christensenellaceae bacterium OttesenSCG-928-K19]